MKCRYCENEATHYRNFDLDLPKMPLCDDISCYAKLHINLNQRFIDDVKIIANNRIGK